MNSEKSWVLQVDPNIHKFIKKIPRRDAERILLSLEDLGKDPFAGDVKKLSGTDLWRKRIGSYRLFYEILTSKKMILIFSLQRRSSKTY